MEEVRLLLVPHPENNHKARLWQRRGLLVLMSLLVVFRLGIGAVERVRPGVLGAATAISPEEVVQLTNDERSRRHLPLLRVDPQLVLAAEKKASDMMNRDYWAHVTPTGEQPWSFITAAGYTYLYAGENLARDFSDPQAVVAAWMASPTHRENLLNSSYRDIGVAVISGELSGVETTLVVQMFGSRRLSKRQASSLAVQGAVRAATPRPTKMPLEEKEMTAQLVALPSPIVIQPSPIESKWVAGVELGEENFGVAYVSPFDLSKAVTLAVVLLLSGVLIIDLMVIGRKKVVRLSGRPWAHLMLIIGVGIILIVSRPGAIL